MIPRGIGAGKGSHEQATDEDRSNETTGFLKLGRQIDKENFSFIHDAPNVEGACGLRDNSVK